MPETDDSMTQANIPEVILISCGGSPPPDLLAETDPSAFMPDNGIPHIHSVKHAVEILAAVLSSPPRVLSCLYDLDDLHFSEMRSSVLRAGIVVLAVQAGHHAVIAPSSTSLPVANWRSEFIFRAVRGISLIKPELSSEQVFFIVSRAIHFYSHPAPPALHSSHIH